MRERVKECFLEDLGRQGPHAGLSLDSVIAAYFTEGINAGRWRGGTLGRMEEARRWLTEQAVVDVNLEIRKINTKALAREVNLLSRSRHSMARQVKTLLNGAFRWASDYEIIDTFPFATDPIKLEANSKRLRPRALSRDERQRLDELLDAFEARTTPGPRPDPAVREIIEVLLATGFRIGEALGIRGQDVHVLDNAAVRLELWGSIAEVDATGKWTAPHWVPTTKTTSESDVPALILALDGRAALYLRHRAERYGDGLIFPTRKGTPRTQSNWRRSMRAVLGDEFEWLTSHTFRKTAGTDRAREIDDSAAAELLGHSGTAVTRAHYIEPLTVVDLRGSLR